MTGGIWQLIFLYNKNISDRSSEREKREVTKGAGDYGRKQRDEKNLNRDGEF